MPAFLLREGSKSDALYTIDKVKRMQLIAGSVFEKLDCGHRGYVWGSAKITVRFILQENKRPS